jgi:hypothetical protein
MRPLIALLLAAATAGCLHAPSIPDQLKGPELSTRGNPALAERVGRARELCRDARKALRAEARSLERRHNLWATLGASFGATGGAAALGATADSDKGVKNTLTITGAVLSVAGAVATGLSSKDSDLMAKLTERALKIKSLESEADALVAKSKRDEGGEGSGDEELGKKLGDLEEACAEP